MLSPDVCRCLSNRVLHLILMPTEACNFRCTYCYEEFRLGRMRPDVVEGVKRFLRHRAREIGDLTISWFGGEPLLASDVIEDIMVHVQPLRRKKPQIRFHSDMTTNGFLLSRTLFERLLDLGVADYQIALDGPREWHNRIRVQANGKGTFDRIWGNLMALRNVTGEFRIRLRLHIDGNNREALPRFVEQCAQEFGRDRRFELFVRPLSPLGGPNDSTYPYLDHSEAGVVMQDLKRCAEESGLACTSLADERSICYAAQGNSFVVRADGRLNKCTVALEHPTNQVGHISANGDLELVAPKMLQWMRGLWSDKREELECPLRGLPEAETRPPRRNLHWRKSGGSGAWTTGP